MAKEVTAVNIPKDKELDIEYDEEADILYISFGKPQPAEDSMEVNDVIHRLREKELVGITIPSFKLGTSRSKL